MPLSITARYFNNTVPTIPSLFSQHAIVVDHASDTVLFQKDPDTPSNPASLTKLVTCMLAVDTYGEANLDSETLTVTSADTSIGGTTMSLIANDVVTVRGLIDGSMMPSGNDAANCLGRGIEAELGGDILDHLATKAAAIGMTNTTFENPYAGGLSSARDVAVSLREIYDNYPDVLSPMSTRTKGVDVTGPNARTITLTTINSMYGEPGNIAVKTGSFASIMGNCGIIYQEPSGAIVVSVTLAATPITNRFVDTRKLVHIAVPAGWQWSGGLPYPRTDFIPQTLFTPDYDKGHIFDLQRAGTCYTDVNGDTQSADTNNIRRIVSSSHGSDALTNGGTVPTFNTGSGLSWATFAGSLDQWLANQTGVTATRAIGYFTVMFAVEVVDSAVTRNVFHYRTSGAGGRAFVELNTTDNWVQGARRTDAQSAASDAGATTQGATKRIVLAEFDYTGDTAELLLWDGAAFQSECQIASINGTGGNTDDTSGSVFFGGREGFTSFNGKIYGMVSIARELTSQEKLDLAGWLETQAGM